MLVFSEVYRDIHEPGLKKWRTDESEIKHALEAIRKFKIKHPLPLMMIALHKYENKTLTKAELVALLSVIEVFVFINTNLMNVRSSGGFAQMYAFHAKALAGATQDVRRRKALTDLVTKLKFKLPSQEQFLEKFCALKYSDNFSTQKREIQYAVTKLFSWMFPAVAINTTEMSIEHIEPQSSKRISAASVASIGNLWFLKTKFNNDLGNSDATLKLVKYKQGQLPCDTVLANATDWSQEKIELRTKELADQFWNMANTRFK